MYGTIEIKAHRITDRSTGIPAICYGLKYENGAWSGGTISIPAFSRWAADGFAFDAHPADPEYVEAARRVGLEEGFEGEMYLMEGWTWERHDEAVKSVQEGAAV